MALMRVLFWYLQITSVLLIICSLILLIQGQYTFGLLFLPSSFCHFITSLLFFKHYNYQELAVVNKHLAQSVFGSAADGVKEEIKKVGEEVKCEILNDTHRVKEELNTAAEIARVALLEEAKRKAGGNGE